MAAVLLIEDDDAQRFVASFALKKAGHVVDEAADGPEGVAKARSGRPDVIVCDVMMPGMTGYEVVATLRADAELATVPMILLTAMSDRKHMRQGMTAGADDYLTKPYRPDELCEAINAVLARRQVQQDAFMNSMSNVVEDALEQQKEKLGKQYESRLIEEINARWTRRANEDGDVVYPTAIVLMADLIGSVDTGPSAGVPQLVRQVQQSARDTLYLFGAAHVIPFGTELMAVFAGDEGTLTTPPELRALRAALALTKAAPRERQPVVALHAGPVTLVAVHDELHGEKGHTLAPGESITCVSSLRELAATSGWRIGASQALANALGALVAQGRKAQTRRGDPATELLPATS
ncbi:MAG TPA: response regulator [Ramlibacter sp.]|jgi:CheY-like chemotaxis protein/putative intracellular protease/amidase